MTDKTRIVNQERRSIVLDFIKENYSLANLLIDLNVWDGTQTVIKCPFHTDSRPSFNIIVDNNYFKCFSCGLSGGYMTFYDKYKRDIEEDGKSFNQHIEELLENDKDMQEKTGVGTIFMSVNTTVPLSELANYKKPEYTLQEVDIRSFELIRRKLIKNDKELMMDFYADIEKGLNMEYLWSKYINGTSYNESLTIEDKDTLDNELFSLFDEPDENPFDDDLNNSETNYDYNAVLNETDLFGGEDDE